ncbi:TorF family putative porin [uncultured Sphingomonas sp.]|uniref:TorF family putative porin n=1 Tax=uncultured Sphingomonas sp. TaxID=158754 RepID=UPI002606544F|nr:TorF family putative porin [uncultured Sphingomonas sp.]
MRKPAVAAWALLAATVVPAQAQVIPHAGVETTTDERRRGISWSDGEGALAASARLDLSSGFDVGVRALTTRGDPRHGGADAVFEPTLGYSQSVNGFRLDAFATGHVFTNGNGPLDYYEGGAGASYTLGPAEAGIEARYAPSQDAIGGSNLYLGLRGRVGVPLTPFSFTASAGRSSGRVNDPVRAARLRPDDTYYDWSFGVQHATGPLVLTVEYTGTDIDNTRALSPFAARNNAGDRIAARAAVSF